MMDLSASRRVNPRLLLVLAGLGGVVVGLLLLGTMSGGDAAQPVRSPSRPAGLQRPEPTVPEPATAEAARSPAIVGRDPFVQLVTEPGAQAAGQSGPAQQAPAAPAGGAGAEGQPVSVPPSPPATGEAGSSADQPAGGGGEATLELQAIARDEAGVERATIVVDGQTFTPAVGETFSYGFRLERIAGSCVEASSGASRATMCVPGG